MAVMGEEAPEVWTDEFRRTGRVVFPVRRRPVLIRLAVVVLLLGGYQVSSLIDSLDSGTTGLVLRALSLSGVLLIAGIFVWQLITQRPVLTVDHEGIGLGRKGFMPWTDIGSIGLPTGTPFYRNVPVLPSDVWAEHLAVPRDNVKDLPALATWLTGILEERRRSETT
jgi:hypothetical protein